MSIIVWSVVAYVFALGLATRLVLELPLILVARHVSRHGLFGRIVDRRVGIWMTFALILLGYVFWFVLLLVPIKFSKEMNAWQPLAVWLGAPLAAGLALNWLWGWWRRRNS